jgi:tRNA(adenine34) deaminase
MSDESFMREALEEARQSLKEGEVPIGAVVVLDDEVIGRGHNSPITLSDPTAHAEVLAIREAARKIGNYRLVGATLYVTLEPCIMCCGGLVSSRIERVVFGAYDPKAGGVKSLYSLLDDQRLNHRVAATGGSLQEECGALLREFFKQRRT